MLLTVEENWDFDCHGVPNAPVLRWKGGFVSDVSARSLWDWPVPVCTPHAILRKVTVYLVITK